MFRRKIWSIVLCVLLITNSQMVVSADNSQDAGERLKKMYEQKEEISDISLEEMLIQNELNDKYQEIEQYMKNQNREYEEEYIDYYGGSYIADNKLVVCVTESEVETHAIGGVEFKKVDNSYNDLLDIQKILEDTYGELYARYSQTDKEFSLLDSIAGIGIDEMDNSVVVDIVSLTNEKEAMFQEIFGSYECVKLSNVEEKAEETVTYRAGRAIYVVTTDGTNYYVSQTSIGYRAYMEQNGNTLYGFVTCGHGIQDSVDKKVYADSQCTREIGRIIEARCDGTVDASFVQFTNNHMMSLQVAYSDTSGNDINPDVIKKSSLVKSLPAGYRVYKVGATTYRTTGTVQSTNYSATVSGIKCTNMIKTTYMTKNGDSGGLMYYYDGQYNIIVGIVKGGNSSYSLFTKASVIVNNMKYYPY